MNSKKNQTIVFCFDGTGNEPSDAGKFSADESISNVLKLHVLLGGGISADRSCTKTENGNPQKTFYFNGIGTRDDFGAIPLLGSGMRKGQKLINQVLAPSWGDAQRILKEAQRDFVGSGYNEGDKLVIFGFSRGAALARKFASQLLKKRKDVKVSFLGVFDTVAAMNGIHFKGERISSDVFFEDGTLHDNVEKAVHIVSLDENRGQFEPTLINKDENNPDRILEIWFPGVHSDIGGGYWYDGLSDLALEFMIKECNKQMKGDISIKNGQAADEIKSLIDSQGDLGVTVDDIIITPICEGMLHKHSGMISKLGAAFDQSDCRDVYIANMDLPDKSERPLVHWSVKDRFHEVKSYRPSALRDLPFRLMLSVGGEVEVDGIAGLRDCRSKKQKDSG